MSNEYIIFMFKPLPKLASLRIAVPSVIEAVSVFCGQHYK